MATYRDYNSILPHKNPIFFHAEKIYYMDMIYDESDSFALSLHFFRKRIR